MTATGDVSRVTETDASYLTVETATLQGSDTTVFSLSVNQDIRLYDGVHKFSENLGVASKF